MDLHQLVLTTPLVLELIIAVVLGVVLHRSRNAMAGMIGLITLTALVMNILPSGNQALDVAGQKFDYGVHLGLDLQGGAQIVLQAREQRDPQGNLIPRPVGAMDAARSIIEQRVAGVGVSEPVVQQQGDDRILVELPGVANPDEVISLIRETGQLEWIDAGTQNVPVGALVCTDLGCPRPEQIAGVLGTPTVASSVPVTGTLTPPAVGAATPGITSTVTTSGTVAAPTATAPPAPTATPVAATGTPAAGPTATPFGGKIYPIVVTGTDVDGNQVKVQYDSTTGRPQVAFVLKGAAATKLDEYTRTHINQFMPIVLDKVVISNPSIQSEIPNGSGVITGLTSKEASDLVVKLRYGALPVALDVVSNRTIGGTLGADSINKSGIAGLVGLLLVMIFMLLYYRLPGLLADVALLIYSLVVFALFRSIPVTLTLAGIAGFILSIGMAVDANVLIFARIKEELRTGKTVRTAVEAGFDHAWPSIRDSNSTTILTTIILYWFGSFFGASIIKGFALTLLIGVLISMFTAVLVTRTFLRLVVDLPIAQNRWWLGIDELKTPAAPPPTEGGTQPT